MELTKELARQFDERLAQRKKRRALIERARQQDIAQRTQKRRLHA